MPKSRRADSTPAELFGPLLSRVQERGILADGKTFVDAVPKRPIADMMADFGHLSGEDAELRAFVEANFELPAATAPVGTSRPVLPLREHIRSMWTRLAREPA